ncbi:hypothetical protein V8E53_000966 [Lactarius tabidus]
MATLQSSDYSSHVINGVYEVASHHVGKSVFDVIRNRFPSGKIRGGNYYMDRSRSLLKQHYTSLPRKDREAISVQFTNATTAKQRIGSAKASIRERYSLAKGYKQVAKHLFIIVEAASQRAGDKTLMAQISEAATEEDPQRPPVGTSSTLSNPFSDSHEASSLADVDIGNLNQVEMSIFESETAGEAAVVLGLQNRDGTTQEIASMILLPTDPGNRKDETAETASVSSCNSNVYGPSEAGGEAGQ